MSSIIKTHNVSNTISNKSDYLYYENYNLPVTLSGAYNTSGASRPITVNCTIRRTGNIVSMEFGNIETTAVDNASPIVISAGQIPARFLSTETSLMYYPVSGALNGGVEQTGVAVLTPNTGLVQIYPLPTLVNFTPDGFYNPFFATWSLTKFA